MEANKEKCDPTSNEILKKEKDVVQQYVKFADKFIGFSFNTEKIDTFQINNKLDAFALVVINNRLGVDVKEIFYNISNIIMKSTDHDNPLFTMTVHLNGLSFTDVRMGQDPKMHRSLISNNCKALNEISYDLAKFILKPEFLNVKKELTDILQDFVSALDRVDVRIESQSTYDDVDAWMEFFRKERKFANKCLYKQYFNHAQEISPDLNLRTMGEVARDIIRMFHYLINYLQKMIYTFEEVHQSVLAEVINDVNAEILNFELRLRNPDLDGRELIKEFMKKSILSIMKSLKSYLFENSVCNRLEDAHMKELAHYVVTEYMVICRRLARRVDF